MHEFHKKQTQDFWTQDTRMDGEIFRQWDGERLTRQPFNIQHSTFSIADAPIN